MAPASTCGGGGKNLALDETFTVTVTDGQLTIGFTSLVDNAKISAIEIVSPGNGITPAVSSTYRGDGLRASQTSGGTTTSYTWDVKAALPVVLQDGTYSYVYGLGGRLLSQTDAASTQSYVLADSLGSTVALTDAAGTVTATYQYDGFGALRTGTGTGATAYRYTGQQDDGGTGLVYLRARYYDPGTGRFLTKDPWRGVAAVPATQHRYVYARNNPRHRTGASGRCDLYDDRTSYFVCGDAVEQVERKGRPQDAHAP